MVLGGQRVQAKVSLLIQIGEKIGARVRGDEFETYQTADQSYIDDEDRTKIDAAIELGQIIVMRARRRRNMTYIFIVLFFFNPNFSGSSVAIETCV